MAYCIRHHPCAHQRQRSTLGKPDLGIQLDTLGMFSITLISASNSSQGFDQLPGLKESMAKRWVQPRNLRSHTLHLQTVWSISFLTHPGGGNLAQRGMGTCPELNSPAPSADLGWSSACSATSPTSPPSLPSLPLHPHTASTPSFLLFASYSLGA